MKQYRYRYCRCRTSGTDSIRRAACDGSYNPVNQFGEAALRALTECGCHPAALLSELREPFYMGGGDPDHKLASLHLEILDLSRQQERLIDLIAKGVVDKDILELRLSSLKKLCSEREGSLRAPKGQQRLAEDAAELQRPGL